MENKGKLEETKRELKENKGKIEKYKRKDKGK
jgi:hypothetical protein